MKTTTALLFYLLLSLVSHSQILFLKDTTIRFISDPKSISYSPSSLISNISYSSSYFKNGQRGIIFSFIAKEKGQLPNIRIDSITLKLSNGKSLILNNPYGDTIVTRYDGGLYLAVLYSLDKSELGILKLQTITTLILIIDKQPLEINLRNKSQRELREFANRDF